MKSSKKQQQTSELEEPERARKNQDEQRKAQKSPSGKSGSVSNLCIRASKLHIRLMKGYQFPKF